MSSEAVALFLARAPREEGRKPFAYNDKTGARVTCKPNGNLSIGEGINLEEGLEPEEIDFLTTNRAKKLDIKLSIYPWYTGANAARQSVFIDVAFNGGIGDLLHYPSMIHFAGLGDWDNASAQLTEKDQKLDASRYAPLRSILKTGVAP